MQDRLRPESHFLKIEEDPNRIKKVRNGEFLFTPGRSQGLKRVPLGLIHDWLGAEFVPHTTLNKVLAVVRDYARYQEFYCPPIVASRALVKSRLEDRFP